MLLTDFKNSGFDLNNMKISGIIHDTAAVMKIEGSLSSEEKLTFEREIQKLYDKKLHLVIDLSKVNFIDSATLGTIMKFHAQYRKIKKYLVLACLNKQIFDVFQLTGVTRQIKIFESIQGAQDFIREL